MFLSRYPRLSMTVLWMALVLLTFLGAGSSSAQSWALLAVAGIMPPAIMLAVWKDAPLTIAEVLNAVERKS